MNTNRARIRRFKGIEKGRERKGKYANLSDKMTRFELLLIVCFALRISRLYSCNFEVLTSPFPGHFNFRKFPSSNSFRHNEEKKNEFQSIFLNVFHVKGC